MSYPATFDTPGQPFILLTTVDSTNNYAMGQAHAGMAKPGTAYFALEQTAGKGQRGKTWNSIPGQNIIMSLILDPGGVTPDKTFMMSASVSLGCYDFYKSLAGDQTTIKWPNDIYWRDRKAGGILIENSIGVPDSSWKCSIAGMGLNINQTDFGDLAKKAVSLKQVTGKDSDPVALAKLLCEFIRSRLADYYARRWSIILEAYNSALFMKGQKVKLKAGPVLFETRVDSVDDYGRLVVSEPVERSFSVGEVSWIL